VPEDSLLLGYDAVLQGNQIMMFWRNLLTSQG